MRKIVVCIVTAFLLKWLCAKCTRGSNFSLSNLRVVAFYNLENLYDTLEDPATNDQDFTPAGVKQYGTAIFEHKLQNLATVISELGPEQQQEPPDIIGVAEIENRRVLELLCAAPLLQVKHYRVIHFDSPDPRGIDVALLFNPRAFRPVFSLPLRVILPGGSKEARFTRDILYVKGLMDTDTLHILVNHWPSRRGGEIRSAPARVAAATTCRRVMDSIRLINPLGKIILMGDLNDDPTSRSITHTLGATGNPEHLSSSELYNPWCQLYKMGIGTLANRDHWSIFDQILVSRGLLLMQGNGWHFSGAGIYRKPFMVENQGRYRGYPMRTWDGNRYRGGYSDHFPTYITLRRGSNSQK
jgi:hypothetical protein